MYADDGVCFPKEKITPNLNVLKAGVSQNEEKSG